MTTRRDQLFLQRLTRKLARRGLAWVRPQIPSRTLRTAVRIVPESDTRIHLEIPHYWAVYVHDGRRSFNKNKLMVWFRNPKDDPRLNGGKSPERASQVRKLTRAQFVFWLKQNRQARAAGRPVPMIVTKSIRTPTVASRFFSNKKGMRGFLVTAKPEASKAARAHILTSVKDILNVDETLVLTL